MLYILPSTYFISACEHIRVYGYLLMFYKFLLKRVLVLFTEWNSGSVQNQMITKTPGQTKMAILGFKTNTPSFKRSKIALSPEFEYKIFEPMVFKFFYRILSLQDRYQHASKF